ncbi:hypothetical protein LXL04_037576 [Taraxacum kok-saghyz]
MRREIDGDDSVEEEERGEMVAEIVKLAGVGIWLSFERRRQHTTIGHRNRERERDFMRMIWTILEEKPTYRLRVR